MPAKRRGDPGTWGNKDAPLLVSVLGWNRMHPFLQERMQHAHLSSGYCIRNTFGAFCSGPDRYDWQIDCEEDSCHQPAVHWRDADDLAVLYDEGMWVCGVHR